MKSVKALYGQTISDICMQEYGTDAAVFELAHYNDVSRTQQLVPGQEILIPENDLKKTDVLRIFKAQGFKPSTQLTQKDQELLIQSNSCCFCKYFKQL